MKFSPIKTFGFLKRVFLNTYLGYKNRVISTRIVKLNLENIVNFPPNDSSQLPSFFFFFFKIT